MGRSVGELAEAAGGGWGPVSTCPSGNAAEEGAGVRTGASGPQKATPGRTQLAWPQTVCTGVCMWEDPGQRSVPSATSQDMPGDPSSTWGFTSSWAGVYTHHQHRRPAGWPSARGWSSLRGPLERQPSGRLAGAGGLPGLSAPPAAPPSPGKTGTDTVELVLLGQQLLRPLWGVRPRKAMASSRALTATPGAPARGQSRGRATAFSPDASRARSQMTEASRRSLVIACPEATRTTSSGSPRTCPCCRLLVGPWGWVRPCRPCQVEQEREAIS